MVTEDFVLGVHRGDRILEVHDRGDRGLQHHILDTRRIGLADRRGRVDLDVDVQTVVLQQDRGRRGRITQVADQFRTIGGQRGDLVVAQRDRQLAAIDRVVRRGPVRAVGQRGGGIEELARELDHAATADRVVAGALLAAVGLGDSVGAVEGVVERAPARIRGVDREARIHHRHHQLGARRGGDLVVHILGGDLEVGRFRA